MVYSIEVNGVESIVFGKAFRIPSGQYPPIIKDIMGNTVSMYEAMNESNNNINRDSSITCTCCKIKRNMELGLDIIAKWREYCVIKAAELGITGIGLTQLNAFSAIGVALSFGCTCSREKCEMAIEQIGEAEALDIIDEQGGNFEMDCGFCGEMYRFNKDDVTTIFSE